MQRKLIVSNHNGSTFVEEWYQVATLELVQVTKTKACVAKVGEALYSKVLSKSQWDNPLESFPLYPVEQLSAKDKVGTLGRRLREGGFIWEKAGEFVAGAAHASA